MNKNWCNKCPDRKNTGCCSCCAIARNFYNEIIKIKKEKEFYRDTIELAWSYQGTKK